MFFLQKYKKKQKEALFIKKKLYLCKKKNMRFSVITINYNNKEGLEHTIESVLSQTNKDYEYIIIDGGSTDGSIDVIQGFSDYITYWISEKDKGVYHAMNKGVIQAHGDYSIFMNSGDCFFDEHVLELISDYTTNSSEDIIVGKVSIDRNNNILTPPPSGEITMYHLYSGAIPHQGAFIKTELLRHHPYDETLKISSDWIFFVNTLILENCPIRYIDEFVALYDTKGISSTNSALMRKEKDEYLKSIFPPRVLADYNLMKESECLTQKITPLLRKNYSIDKLLFRIGKTLLRIKGAF